MVLMLCWVPIQEPQSYEWIWFPQQIIWVLFTISLSLYVKSGSGGAKILTPRTLGLELILTTIKLSPIFIII